MDGIILREATADDGPAIVGMIRRMVADMARHGGYPAAEDEEAWARILVDVAKDLSNVRHKYLVAEAPAGGPCAVAAGEINTIGGAFAPVTSLHVSIVFVAPEARRQGLASALLAGLFEWGKANGCTQSDLNVLKANPAMRLYEKQGFVPFEVRMVRGL